MKHRKRKLSICLFFVYILVLGLSPISGLADETDAGDSGSFTYKVIHPDNQISSVGYFDLRMVPGQKQTVQIELKNPSTEVPVTVSIALNSAKTNANGVLEYGPAAIEKDESLKYDFEEIVTAPETLTLQPEETKLLDLAIAMPEEPYDGYIAGGIQLEVVLTEEAKALRKKQTGIINDYAFLIGLLLSESDTEVQPELVFNKIYPDLSNYRNAVFASFSNRQMGYVKNMTVDFQVMKKGSDEVLYDTKKTEMRMAPNSKIDFPLVMNGDQMVPGKYTGHIVVTSGEKQWEWTEDFEITKEEAEKYNKQDVSLVQERSINWILIGGIAAVALVLLVLLFVVVHMVNQNKKRKRAQQKRKRAKKV